MGAGSSNYFNAVPLFILFREAIEASIVVSVLLTFVNRSVPRLKAQIWWGVGIGVGLSLVLGAIFAIVYYQAQQNLFQGGAAQFLFKGIVAWIASIFITYLAFAMLRYEGWEKKWARKLIPLQAKLEPGEQLDTVKSDESSETDFKATAAGKMTNNPISDDPKADPNIDSVALEVITTNEAEDSDLEDPYTVGCWKRLLHQDRYGSFLSYYSLFFAVFIVILREGLESIIFLFGVGNAAPASIPISGLIGIACGLGVGVLLYYTGREVKDIKWLLFCFATVLFFIAAGSCENGAHWLMEGGMYGEYLYAPTVVTAANTGAITSTLYGGVGQPAAPSLAALAAAGFSDGDEAPGGVAMANPQDGYTYLMTAPQPWWQAPLWDLRGSPCCGDTDQENQFLALCKVLFGYRAQPCFIDCVWYLAYWTTVLLMGLWKSHSGTLTDADHKYNKVMKKQLEQAALAKEAALRVSSEDCRSSEDTATSTIPRDSDERAPGEKLAQEQVVLHLNDAKTA